MPDRLKSISVRGFKSFESLESLELGALNVLIGANGAGKSNLLSVFRMLSNAFWSRDQLPYFVGQQGGASAFLFDGPEKTESLAVELVIETEEGVVEYAFELGLAAGDRLTFRQERYRSSGSDPTITSWKTVGTSGYDSPKLPELADSGDTTAREIRALIRHLEVFQFHNTSFTSKMRMKSHVNAGPGLRSDGANLASFLYQIREHEPDYYGRILDTIRLALPFVADLVLEPEFEHLLLGWREKGSSAVFDVSQAADGMLRFIALTALLLQPRQNLPNLIALDEPELGLHPYAIDLLAGMLSTASQGCQVVLATQSVPLLDYFEAGDVLVVDRRQRASTIGRLDPAELKGWLEEYSLSELWDQNVLGGRPA